MIDVPLSMLGFFISIPDSRYTCIHMLDTYCNLWAAIPLYSSSLIHYTGIQNIDNYMYFNRSASSREER